jgi:predicted O-methyltransferase YrrM
MVYMHDVLVDVLADARKRLGRDSLRILETGMIRGTTDNYRTGDGWSTLTFAEHVRDHGGSLTSIDIDPEAAVAARAVLEQHELDSDSVELVTGHSIDVLAGVAYRSKVPVFDVVLLDSANDPDLILHEYLTVYRLITSGGFVLIDDVDMTSTGIVKGHAIAPWFNDTGVAYQIVPRDADGYATGVIVADVA